MCPVFEVKSVCVCVCETLSECSEESRRVCDMSFISIGHDVWLQFQLSASELHVKTSVNNVISTLDLRLFLKCEKSSNLNLSHHLHGAEITCWLGSLHCNAFKKVHQAIWMNWMFFCFFLYNCSKCTKGL